MRADKFFAEKFGSRTKAAEAIEKGWVLVNGKTIRAKDEIKDFDEIVFVEIGDRFVSNGGYKLARAFETFKVDCSGQIFVDIGASTGGFTDCLLQNGAKRVYAVDVGESQLHPSLINNSNVVVMDNCNARYLSAQSFPETINGVVTDVSFISLRLIFPTISKILGETGNAFVLIKPQFECENKNIGKSGIVKPSAHVEIVKKVVSFAIEEGLYPHAIVNAPVRKGKNIEYIVWLKKVAQGGLNMLKIESAVKAFIKLNSEGLLT
jgi:23S rRNA (cytidine1920-2'-O)/16S rRNA (cytidine1409-2'-O)-methyltransferase